jgi:hypothetical protein
MRRILTTTIASSLLALALPAAASAHPGRNDVAHRAGVHHRRHHHRRAHTVVFTPAPVTPGTSTTTTETPPPADEAAGTIASFEGGVLKITLADGSTVTGKVTEMTEIQCGCDGNSGDQGEDHGDFGRGAPGPGDFHGDDENGGSAGQSTSCGTASLVPGAKVREAELSLSGAGAVWEKVELQ